MPSQESKLDDFEKKLEGLFVVYGPQGGFWGPNRQGYWNSFCSAGFYTKEQAIAMEQMRRGDRKEPAVEAYRRWREYLSPDFMRLLFGA